MPPPARSGQSIVAHEESNGHGANCSTSAKGCWPCSCPQPSLWEARSGASSWPNYRPSGPPPLVCPRCSHERPHDLPENSIDVISLLRQPPWPRNRLRICPTDRKLVVGPIRAGTRQRLSEAVCRPFGGQGSECAHRRPTRMRRTRYRPYANCYVRAMSRLSIRSTQAASIPMLPRQAACRMSGERTTRQTGGPLLGTAPQSNRYGASVRIEKRKRLGSGRQ